MQWLGTMRGIRQTGGRYIIGRWDIKTKKTGTIFMNYPYRNEIRNFFKNAASSPATIWQKWGAYVISLFGYCRRFRQRSVLVSLYLRRWPLRVTFFSRNISFLHNLKLRHGGWELVTRGHYGLLLVMVVVWDAFPLNSARVLPEGSQKTQNVATSQCMTTTTPPKLFRHPLDAKLHLCMPWCLWEYIFLHS